MAFAVLSRLQNEPARLKSYFLKGYSLILALTMPITVLCAFFSNDIILVLLGAKWANAAPLFRLLAPTIHVFAIANPLSWLLSSIGLVSRLLEMGFVIAPVMMSSYAVGLPFGPKGVAFAYSAVMTLWLVPLVIWALRGTVVRPAGYSGAGCSATLDEPLRRLAFLPFILRMVTRLLASPCMKAVLFLGSVGMILLFTEQKIFYMDLLRGS